MQIQVFLKFQTPVTSKTCLIKKTNNILEFSKKNATGCSYFSSYKKLKYFVIHCCLSSNARRIQNKKRKGCLEKKMGSRPNEIKSWHMPGVLKEKHEKSVQLHGLQTHI
jgi:hypothetical protein